MAKIQSQNIVITLNKLVKDSDGDTVDLVSADLLSALESVTEELAGTGIVVEIQVA